MAVDIQTQSKEPQPLALAQLVRRLTWVDIRACALDDERALADQGFAPR
ncbi:DUF7706 family protein [Cupriavidus plantarum]|nr:hypothetical protein [Cupriavidus plantarum]